MVKLDLEINEIIGLAELGKIDNKKLKKFLETATKEELVNYLLKVTTYNEEENEEEDEENINEEENEEDL